MPRNGSGAYTLPAGNPVASGTTIATAWGNGSLSDIASEITNSLDRNGRGSMLAALKLTDGLVGAPGATFSNEPTSGFYRNAAGDVRVSVLGANIGGFNATGFFTNILKTTVVANPTSIISTYSWLDAIRHSWIDSAQAADGKIVEWLWTNNKFKGRFVNDAYTLSAGCFMQVTPGAGGTVAAVDFGTGSNSAHAINLQVAPLATAVNYWSFVGSAAGTALNAVAAGTDAVIGMNYITKSTGVHNFYSNAGAGQVQFQVLPVAGSTRYLAVSGSVAGNPSIVASGGSIGFSSDVQGSTATFSGLLTAGSLAAASLSLTAQPGFSAYRSSNIVTVAGTIIFDTEIFDTGNCYNNATGVFTVPAGQGGKYLITASVTTQHVGAAGNHSIETAISSIVGLWGQTGNLAAADRGVAVISGVVSLSAGDTVSIFSRSSAGTNDLIFQPLGAGAQRGAWFTIHKIA